LLKMTSGSPVTEMLFIGTVNGLYSIVALIH